MVQRGKVAACPQVHMADSDLQHLSALIANEKRDRLELLAQVVIGLGHDVIAREIEVKEVGPATARESPDVALVGLGSRSGHALELISEIVREASCPVKSAAPMSQRRLETRSRSRWTHTRASSRSLITTRL